MERARETPKPTTVVLEFIDTRNVADVSGLCSLVTQDPVFIDGLPNRVQGGKKLRAGWNAYFAWFPDYRISQGEIFEDRNVVAIFASASRPFAVNGEP